MRNTAILCAAAASMLLASCVRVNRDPVTGRVDTDVESPLKTGEDWTGTLQGRGSWTSIAGDTRVTRASGETTVTVSLRGATSGGRHPWHLHEGTCASDGPIVGDPAAYAPLSVGMDGRASGSARFSAPLNEARKYHVNVHLSGAQMGTVIACADLSD